MYMNKTYFLIGSLLLLCFLLSTVGTNELVQASSADSWWNINWRYRKQLTITGTTAGAQENYQIRVTVHIGTGTDSTTDVYIDSGKVKDNFGDVRWVTENNVELDYWVEELVGGDYAVFWVEIPSIPASPNTTKVYMYYGNPNAVSKSNGDNTFDFFDNFSGDSLDNNKWGATSGTVTVSDGWCEIVAGSITTAVNFPDTVYPKIEAKIQVVKHATGIGYWNVGTRILDNENTTFLKMANYSYEYNFLLYFDDNDHWYSGPYPTNGLIRLVTYFDNDEIGIELSGAQTGSASTSHTTPLKQYKIKLVGPYNPDDAEIEVDWIFVRKYTSPEPTCTWGSEEKTIQINLKWEENFQPIDDNIVENVKNWWIMIVYENYETQEERLTKSSSCVGVAQTPLIMRVIDKTDNYFRTLIPRTDNLTFYMVSDSNLSKLYYYTVKLGDPTGTWDPTLVWGPPDGSITWYKYEEDKKVYINDVYWSGTSDAMTYLIFGHVYHLRLESPTGGVLEYGTFEADVNTSRTITPHMPVEEAMEAVTTDISWGVWWDGNYLTVKYVDNAKNTEWVRVRVFDENDVKLWDNTMYENNFTIKFGPTDPDLSYTVTLSIKIKDSPEFGTTKLLFGALPEPIPQPVPASPPALDILGDSPVPFGHLFIAGLLLFVIVAFGPGHAGIGVIAVAITATMLKIVLGLGMIGWEFIALLVFMGVVVQMVEARKGYS